MLPYITIFILFLFGLAFGKHTDAAKNGYYWFLAIVTILMTGLRDMIGGFDIYIYSEVYEAPNDYIKIFPSFEIGFRYYFVLLKQISENREFMVFATAVIMTLLHFIALKRHATNLFFTLFLYFCKFYLMSFVYLRQGISMGIIWLSIPFIVNRKFLPFLATSFLAFLFHKSSLVFFPLYFVANWNFTKKQYIWIPIATLIFSVSPLSNMVIGILGETVDPRYAHYTNKSTSFNIFYLIESALIAILLVTFRDDLAKHKFGKFLNNGLFVYILISLMSITNATYLRFIWYYLIFLLLALPVFVEFVKSKTQKSYLQIAIMLYFTLLFFRLLILWDGGDMMPYKTIFDDTPRNGLWEWMEYRHRKMM